jgi:hypothetical protein
MNYILPTQKDAASNLRRFRASERNQQTNALVAAPLKATPLGTIDGRKSGT